MTIVAPPPTGMKPPQFIELLRGVKPGTVMKMHPETLTRMAGRFGNPGGDEVASEFMRMMNFTPWDRAAYLGFFCPHITEDNGILRVYDTERTLPIESDENVPVGAIRYRVTVGPDEMFPASDPFVQDRHIWIWLAAQDGETRDRGQQRRPFVRRL